MTEEKMSDSQDYEGVLTRLGERLEALCPEMRRAVRARVALDDHIRFGGPFSLFAELTVDSAPGGCRRQDYAVLNEEAAGAIADLAKTVGALLPGDMAYLLDRAIETYAANAGAAEVYRAWHKLGAVSKSQEHAGLLDDPRLLDNAMADAAAVLKQPLEELAWGDSEEDRAPGACAAKADRILAVGRTEETRQL